MLNSKPSPCGRAWRGALLATVLCAAVGGMAWGAPAGNADAAGATESQPGINASGLNTWMIGSTPVTELIPVNKLAHAALPKAIADAGVLEVGAITDEPPFVFVQDGKLQGVDIDMISALSQALGVKIHLHKTSFDAMIPGLQAHRFDVHGQRLEPIDLRTFPGSAPVFLALKLGRVDVSPITYAIATYVVKLHPYKYQLTEICSTKATKAQRYYEVMTTCWTL